MRSHSLPRISRPTVALAVVFAVTIFSTATGAEDGALAMREPRPVAQESVPAAPHLAPAPAAISAPQPDARSASLRFWRNGGLPDASAPDDSAPVTVVIADTRSPATHDGLGRAVAIWRDGGER